MRKWREWMFVVAPGPRSTARAIGWWEARRPAFNVLLVGIGGIGLLLHAAALELRTGAVPSIHEVRRFAAWFLGMGNLLYPIGWLFEIDPRSQPADRTSVGAFFELACWTIAVLLWGLVLAELAIAAGVWAGRR